MWAGAAAWVHIPTLPLPGMEVPGTAADPLEAGPRVQFRHSGLLWPPGRQGATRLPRSHGILGLPRSDRGVYSPERLCTVAPPHPHNGFWGLPRASPSMFRTCLVKVNPRGDTCQESPINSHSSRGHFHRPPPNSLVSFSPRNWLQGPWLAQSFALSQPH